MASLPYGYWTYGTRNGLEGAESTLKELPNGQVVRLKDPDHPCVLEDEFILFAVRNDLNARRQFFTLLPTMDAVSQERLNGLVGRYPSAFNVTLDSTTLSDNIQMKGVVPTRPDTCRNRYLEVPKPNCVSRTNTKPEAYSSGPVEVLEGASVSISIPTSIKYTTTVTGLPRGLRWNGSRITGTAPLVTEDESYTITVLRSNSIGSTPGVFVLTIKDDRPL
jgi:hypothetical protein